MEFDFSELTGRIVTKYRTKKQFAKAAQMSESSLSMKLNGKTPWTSHEIHATQQLLEIPPEDLMKYFFTVKVHNL